MKLFMLLFIISHGICVFSISNSDILIKNALLIANKAYQKRQSTSIVWGRSDQIIVQKFLKQFNGTVVAIKLTKDFELNNKDFQKKVLYKQTVFFAEDPGEFDFFLNIINTIIIEPIRIVVVIVNQNKTEDIYNEFTKIAWERNVGDILLLGYNNHFTLKTYYPYGNGVCGNYSSVNVNINTTKFFKRKYANFHGCPIRVTILEFLPYVKLVKERDGVVDVSGIDGNLLKLMLGQLNASMDIISSTDHGGISTCVNGTRVGSFTDMVYGYADIMVPALIIISLRYAVSQISYVYYTVDIVWCLPNRREIYQWAKALLPFYNLTTSFIIVAFVTIFAILMLTKRFRRLNDRSHKGTVFKMLGIFLGQEVKVFSDYRFINTIFSFWIWFSLIVRISYQVTLIDGLHETFLERPTKTLADAIKIVDETGGMPSFVELYKNTSIEEKYKPLNLSDLPVYMKEVAAGKRFLLAVDMLQLTYYRQKLQILDERVTSMPACIHMRPRWPAAVEINRLIIRIVESGLIVKVWRDMKHEQFLGDKEIKVQDVKPLDMKTLSSCFYGLILMYIISCAVLCTEMLFSKYKKISR